jgi:hypothetical protein
MPYCRVCHIGFKSPMLYENHICSLDHLKVNKVHYINCKMNGFPYTVSYSAPLQLIVLICSSGRVFMFRSKVLNEKCNEILLCVCVRARTCVWGGACVCACVPLRTCILMFLAPMCYVRCFTNELLKCKDCGTSVLEAFALFFTISFS